MSSKGCSYRAETQATRGMEKKAASAIGTCQGILPLTWVRQCKCTPEGEIKKLKAHLFV
jgi:hypothetical protein